VSDFEEEVEKPIENRVKEGDPMKEPESDPIEDLR